MSGWEERRKVPKSAEGRRSVRDAEGGRGRRERTANCRVEEVDVEVAGESAVLCDVESVSIEGEERGKRSKRTLDGREIDLKPSVSEFSLDSGLGENALERLSLYTVPSSATTEGGRKRWTAHQLLEPESVMQDVAEASR